MADKTSNATASLSHVNEITRISVGAEIRQGVLVSANDIRIDGRFFGKIATKGKIVVGEQAVVNGDVCCQNIDIWGNVTGKIICGDVLTLMNPCNLKGNIQSQKLSVENGAKFNGECRIINQDEFGKLSGEFEKSIAKTLDQPTEDTALKK